MEKGFSGILSYNLSYKAALKALHGLQSNSEYLKLADSQRNSQMSAEHKLLDTKKYLLRTGITMEQLDTLSVIHVAGTKGKGSTCAYIEAILRKHGFKTGFFSSPHLVTVRERIRINGQPISESHFTRYFWRIYKQLEDSKEHEYDMPAYFKFLTILMFNIFLDEYVDVAVIEVGIGGLYDCTNIVRNPVCVGITSLGLEHTSLLGGTLAHIAYQKAGIFKPGTVAFSVPQPSEAMKVLGRMAVEKNCKLHVVPAFERYVWDNLSPLRTAREPQQQNASLAIQMAIEWLRRKEMDYFQQSTVNNEVSKRHEKKDNVSMDKIAKGLNSCKWPGRMQILRSSIGDFFLDGAHTLESMECCISWYRDATDGSKGKRFLIFNTSGTRDPLELLKHLKPLPFHKAYFVPNFAGIESVDDKANSSSTMDEELKNEKRKCKLNSLAWNGNSMVATSVFTVLQDIKNEKYQDNREGHQILVTGSLHLVGAVLTILDPNLTMTTQF